MTDSLHNRPPEGAPRLRWSLLQKGREPRLWVFIHGYSAAAGPSRLSRLKQHILAARLPGMIYLANWNAGDWKFPCTVPVLRNTWRLCRAGSLLHPAGLAADAGLWLAGQAWHFRHYERKADRVGQTLPRQLAALSHSRNWPVTLVGHSLGTRVIQSALLQHDWHGISLEQVWLMAGAAEVQTTAWVEAAEKVKHPLVNAYSKSDHVLTAIPDRRKRIGRHPIHAPRVQNHYCEGFRHGDYWPRLGKVLALPSSSPVSA